MMRLAVTIGGIVVGVGVALQLTLMIVSLAAGYLGRGGSLAGDAGFFAAFLGLAMVPLALVLVLLAGIGRWVRARQDAGFFTRALGAAVTMMLLALAILLGGVGALGGGIIPH